MTFPQLVHASLSAAALVVVLGLSTPLAHAAGGAPAVEEKKPAATKDGSKGQADSQPDRTTCPKGQIWDVKGRKCLEKKSGVLPDAQMAQYAYILAKSHRYTEAIETLDLLRNPNTARALNYRGYATRKLGKIEEGIGFYLRSVELDPDYAQVREYLGEAYAEQGKLDLANQQLDVIARLCGGASCRYYEDLSEAIRRGRGG